MKIGVLGTGMVGQTIGTRLIELGYETMMGSRRAGNEKAVDWAAGAGELASEGSFADAAGFADSLVVNATAGIASLDALRAAGESNLSGKVIIDVSNALDASSGFPPTLSVCNTDSVGEQIQRVFPDAKVVKALNTMNCDVMVHPELLPSPHIVFVCGNDAAAKDQVSELLQAFGWPLEHIMDLGDIQSARGMEMYVMFWIRMFSSLGNGHFNINIVQGD